MYINYEKNYANHYLNLENLRYQEPTLTLVGKVKFD